MKYIDYEFYTSLYGDKAINEADFNRVAWNSEREIDKATSGVDNVKKLQVAFPTNEDDAEAVKRCVCDLVDFLSKIENAEREENSVSNLVEMADGTLRGNVVTSISAGNESRSFAVGKSSNTAISTAIQSVKDRDLTIHQFIASRLSGIADANGVNLLYVGVYPCRVTKT